MKSRQGNVALLLVIVVLIGGAVFLYLQVRRQKAEHYEEAMMARQRAEAEQLASVLLSDSEREQAEELYEQRCAVCHGVDGSGMLGPDLTDAEWLHGSSITDIAKGIENGYPEQSMPPMKDVLKNNEISLLSRFVKELGKN